MVAASQQQPSWITGWTCLRSSSTTAAEAITLLSSSFGQRGRPSSSKLRADSFLSRKVSDAACQNAVEQKSILVSAPNWDHAEVPAAYRALVYEHVIDRLRQTKDVGRVYRDGEGESLGGCPQYVVHISIATFKEGSSVKRAFMGPVGMFVGTTQMKFDVTFTDASGKLNTREQITATMRGESESTNVADHVAKSLAKHYAAVLKNASKSNSAKNTFNPAS